MKQFKNYQERRFVMHLLLATCVLVASSAVVRAQSTFEVDFNANAGILATGASLNGMMNAKWNTPLALLMDFNSVAIRVFNDTGSSANITQFALTIGDERFNFANYASINSLLLDPSTTDAMTALAVASDPTIIPLDFTTAIATTSDLNGNIPVQVAAGADNADRVVVDFGGVGIAPGDSALFELRFEFDDSIPVASRPTNEPLLGIGNSVFTQQFPSYQRILFDTDAPNPPFFNDPLDLADLTDNATIIVTYGTDGPSDRLSLPDMIGVAPLAAVDPRHPAPAFITPELNGSVGVIPEPSSLALLTAGLTGIAMLRRRYR